MHATRAVTSCLLFMLAMFTVAMVGCDHHDGHDHHEDADHHAENEDVHVAPHNGQLVPVGEHFANVEFVLDATSGKLTAYMLDAHADNPARVAQPNVVVNVTRDGQTRAINLHAIANALTGETVGDTSQFDSDAGALTGTDPIDIEIVELTIRGQRFNDIKATLKPAK